MQQTDRFVLPQGVNMDLFAPSHLVLLLVPVLLIVLVILGIIALVKYIRKPE